MTLRSADFLDSRAMRRILCGVVGAFAVAACVVAWLVHVQQQTVFNAERYDAAFYSIRAATETSALGMAVGLLVADPGDATLADGVERRYGILRGRAEGMERGAFFGIVSREDHAAESVRAFVDDVESLEPLVRGASDPEVGRRIVSRVVGMQRALTLIGAAVSGQYTAETTADRLMLQRCHALFSGLLLGLLLSGVSLIFLIMRAGRRIETMANTDFLTGLVNRMRLKDQLTRALSLPTHSAALMCLDLDRFKGVNDTLGHHVGDLLLRTTARRIADAVGPDAVVARLGGDEFCVLLKDGSDRDAVVELARRVADRVREPMDLDGHRVIVETSVGIAFSADGCGVAADLLKRADVALYRSKSEGGTRIFEEGMDARQSRRRRYESDLRVALEEKRFELHFQPVVDLADPSRIVGREALVRWNHPEHGMVPPSDFVPVAEEIGLIVPLGAWILREACRKAAAWPGRERVAVNVSSVQFRRDDVPRLVAQALAESGLPASRLEIEITESVLVADVDAMTETIRRLVAMGVRVAMDDFGTGYSSLSYVANFDFHKLKIDRSFVSGMDQPRNREIVSLILALARSRGMTVTAEGVETREQADMLREMGCGEAQGYFFGRPQAMPEAAVPAVYAKAA